MIDPRHPNFASTPVAGDRPRYRYAPADIRASAASPSATIITPFYNVGPVFHETARSVLQQSLQCMEWIIVNDASTDAKSLAILDEYRRLSARDPRVRVIDRPVNGGLSAARNTGFAAARTPYVFQLDGDDLIEPTTLEKCALTLECNPELAFTKGWSVGFEGQEYLWDKGFERRLEFLDENRVTATAMIRRDVHAAVGGFEERVRGGLEDWEFWLKCAARGHWGRTIPEYLDWYRRRPAQHDAWANLKTQDATHAFREGLRAKFPAVFAGHMPDPVRAWHMPMQPLPPAISFENRLAQPGAGDHRGGDQQGADRRRLLMIVPWLRLGGADKFNLDLLSQLRDQGWDLTVVTTLDGNPWLGDFARVTPDIFMLGNLGGLIDQPRLLRYLIQSRQPETVLISNSELGYQLLPYLRAHCPGPAYVDYVHMEEEHWKFGGHARSSVGWQPQLDVSITSSEHLKGWCVQRGATPERIRVCTTNNDVNIWRPDPAGRARRRQELGIADDTPVVLYAVRLTDQKQPLVFAETMRLLSTSVRSARGDTPGFIALVAGDGECRGELEARLGSDGLLDIPGQLGAPERACVRLLGSVPTERMPELFASSDVFFLPSKWEGIALSVFEAMASELTVVAADVGGQAELVVPGTGCLIDHRTPTDQQPAVYAELLAGLLRDPALRRATGRAARQRIVEHFPLSGMGERMVELFGQASELRDHEPRERLSVAFAEELASQMIELTRLHNLAEHLWPFREEVRASRSREQLTIEKARADLAKLEAAPSWQAVVKLRQSAIWRMLARARFGPGWERGLEHDDPRVKLDKIRSSRTYRVVRRVGRID
jgi:glycosyltransferase involved in cell wall biosynthesis